MCAVIASTVTTNAAVHTCLPRTLRVARHIISAPKNTVAHASQDSHTPQLSTQASKRIRRSSDITNPLLKGSLLDFLNDVPLLLVLTHVTHPSKTEEVCS